MSSRTSKASFPPGFCSCPELPAHPSGGLKCVLGRQLALAVSVPDVLLPELPFPPPLDPGHWFRSILLILPALCVLLYLSVSLPGNPVVWLPRFVSTPAPGTVGAGALLPLLMGSGASSWDPPKILHVLWELQHLKCLEGHKINCAASASLTVLAQEGTAFSIHLLPRRKFLSHLLQIKI